MTDVTILLNLVIGLVLAAAAFLLIYSTGTYLRTGVEKLVGPTIANNENYQLAAYVALVLLVGLLLVRFPDVIRQYNIPFIGRNIPTS